MYEKTEFDEVLYYQKLNILLARHLYNTRKFGGTVNTKFKT